MAEFVVDAGLAPADGAVHANAELPVAAEAAAHVDVRANLAGRAAVDRHARERLVVGALESEIDAAADRRAGRRRAVQERVRALEHLHAFEHVGRDQLAGRDAIQAAQRDIVAVQLEAANHEHFGKIAETESRAHGGIVREQRPDRLRLGILDRLRCVTRHAERHVAGVLGAEHAEFTTARNLTARIGRRVIAGQRRRRALHLDGRQGVVGAGRCRAGLLVRRGGHAERQWQRRAGEQMTNGDMQRPDGRTLRNGGEHGMTHS